MHVLEECAGQHRQAEFDVEDDQEHPQEAAPDAHLQKLSGVGHDGWNQEEGFRYLDEFFTKGHIFENGPSCSNNARRTKRAWSP